MLLVIDIGTSTFKAALLKYDGRGVNSAEVPLSISSVQGSRHETESARWLRAFEEVLPRLGSLNQVEAVVISGNGPTVVPVTGEPSLAGGKLQLPAAQARLWLDRRAQEEAKTVSALQGGYVDPSFFLPKMLAVRNQEPELYAKTRHFLATPEFLAYALTGQARTVFPSAGFDRWYWNDGVLKQAGLDTEKFPPFVSPGDEIGTLLPAVTARFGFSPQVKVIAGGPDFFVSILGTGTVRPGQGCDRSGTSEGINVCTQNRINDPRLMSYGHPITPYWNCSGIISTSGKAIAWGRDILGIADHEAFYALAAAAPPGAGGLLFLPYLAGERAPIWDPNARGVFVGLSLSTRREEIARAIAEGVCFAIRDVITVMEEAGANVGELRVTGGPAESAFLNQLKADISRRPVLLPGLPEHQAKLPAELLGLGVIGAAAMGKYPSFGEAAEAFVGIEKTFTPNPDTASVYEDRFGGYRSLYQCLKPQFERTT
ncbi:xylulokinase [Spirochaetia bacterium]|nr:xylulokinase [Spirochaetia bacterium]